MNAGHQTICRYSTPRSTSGPRVRSGKPRPRPGIAGGRCSGAGSARPPKDARHGRHRARLTGARRGGRRGRADAHRGAPRRACRLTCWRPTSRPRSCDYARVRGTGGGFDQRARRWSSTASSTTRCPRAPSTRRSRASGSSTFPTSSKALPGIRQRLSPAGASRRWSIRRPTGTRSSRFRSAIIRRRAKLPPPLPGQPGPFSLGARRRARGGARTRRLPRRRGRADRVAGARCRRPRNACASSASRSARCTR